MVTEVGNSRLRLGEVIVIVARQSIGPLVQSQSHSNF
jgi:hypothetical protein